MLDSNLTEKIETIEKSVENVGNPFYGILLCLAIVLIGFIILWLILFILGFYNGGNMIRKNRMIKQKKDEEAKKTADSIIPANANKDEEDENELIAVITAAVAAVLQKPVSGFRVVSFKKRSGWKLL